MGNGDKTASLQTLESLSLNNYGADERWVEGEGRFVWTKTPFRRVTFVSSVYPCNRGIRGCHWVKRGQVLISFGESVAWSAWGTVIHLFFTLLSLMQWHNSRPWSGWD